MLLENVIEKKDYMVFIWDDVGFFVNFEKTMACTCNLAKAKNCNALNFLSEYSHKRLQNVGNA